MSLQRPAPAGPRRAWDIEAAHAGNSSPHYNTNFPFGSGLRGRARYGSVFKIANGRYRVQVGGRMRLNLGSYSTKAEAHARLRQTHQLQAGGPMWAPLPPLAPP